MAEPLIVLTREPIEPESLRRSIESPDRGGVVIFCGEVRRITLGKATSKLEYEAYEPMAIEQMRRLAADCAEKWDAEVACAHRLGELWPGEIAVVTAAACGHRDAAFACCRELIDRIKEDVPIWKKEFGPDGEEWVGESA